MNTVTLTTPNDIARFWVKVDKSGDCWLWTAATVRKYGMFAVLVDGKKRMRKAHRISFELANGPIPTGGVIDHVCHHEACVNPDHLRVTTVKQNAENRAGANKGTKSGVRGVHWHSPSGRWRVVIGHKSKQVFGGSFSNIEAASIAARELRLRLFTHSAEADNGHTNS